MDRRIYVNFEKEAGLIKPLHGINNGPLSYGDCMDQSAFYQQAGIPYVRLHDTDFPFGFRVNIHVIFPDFSADVNAPASYNFLQTDVLMAAIFETGAQPIYRLGENIEHCKHKTYVYPPKDYEKWADICIHIIRHYNEGWANGFHYGIQYWEIWNEPDLLSNMWVGGTAEDYYRLYITTAKRIKAACPGVMIGGYAGCDILADNCSYLKGFLECCRRENAPMDFFSWHHYDNTAAAFIPYANTAAELLEQYGYGGIEILCDEWNYMDNSLWDASRGPGAELVRQQMYEARQNIHGAAFTAAVLMAFQDLPVDAAAYLDGQPYMEYCGLFNSCGVPQKTFYSFCAFNELFRLGTRIHTTAPDGIPALAARDERTAAVLLCCESSGSQHTELELNGFSSDGYDLEIAVLDETHNLEVIHRETIRAQHCILPLEWKGPVLYLLRLKGSGR